MRQTLLRMALALLLLPAASRAHADVSTPIAIAVTAETAQQVTAHLAGAALERVGRKVHYVLIPEAALLDQLRSGAVQLLPEWDMRRADAAWPAAIEAGEIVDLGRRGSEEGGDALRKLVWKSFGARWPEALKLLKNMTYPSADQAAMTARIAAGQPLDEVVATWMAENEPIWKRWTSTAKNWMKP